MNSQNFDQVAALQSYVRDFHDKLITETFVDYTTGQVATPHEGVKGVKTLTQLTISALSKRYSSDFNPTVDALTYAPRELETIKSKVDLLVVPSELEESYLGRHRQKGQNDKDLPFEGQIISQIVSKVAAELEEGAWKAVKTAIPTANDPLLALMDGYHKKITDEVAAGNLTEIATGALTNTNAVGAIEAMFGELGSGYMNKGVDVFVGSKAAQAFIQDYRTRYGTTSFSFQSDKVLKLDIGKATFRLCDGMKENAVLITPKENLHYGFDAKQDRSLINFEQRDRSIKMWMTYRYGVNFGMVNDDIMVVNDQH